jgi:hypothetical protein
MSKIINYTRSSSLVPAWILEIMFIYAFFWPEGFANWMRTIVSFVYPLVTVAS